MIHFINIILNFCITFIIIGFFLLIIGAILLITISSILHLLKKEPLSLELITNGAIVLLFLTIILTILSMIFHIHFHPH